MINSAFEKVSARNLGRNTWGSCSPASHCGYPGSTPEQAMWNLWWVIWYWIRFLFEQFRCSFAS